jgi:hypothetical protein
VKLPLCIFFSRSNLNKWFLSLSFFVLFCDFVVYRQHWTLFDFPSRVVFVWFSILVRSLFGFSYCCGVCFGSYWQINFDQLWIQPMIKSSKDADPKTSVFWLLLFCHIICGLSEFVRRFIIFICSDVEFVFVSHLLYHFEWIWIYLDLVKKEEGWWSIKHHVKTVVVNEWYTCKTFWCASKKLRGVGGLESKNKIFGLFLWRGYV